jgi:hypothetical protein
MSDGKNDPTMPKRPPIAALKAIEQIRAYRSWAAIDMYLEIREALQEPHEYPPEPGRSGDGRPPNQ